MLENLTLQNFGALGNNQAQNTNVALINAPGPGRYKIWGQVRHSVADGCKLTSPFTLLLTSGPNDTASFGPVIYDIVNSTSGIIIALNVATGVADTASATVYAQRLDN